MDNKCERCRYKLESNLKCTAKNSPMFSMSIQEVKELTDGEGCHVFYSEDTEENFKLGSDDDRKLLEMTGILDYA